MKKKIILTIALILAFSILAVACTPKPDMRWKEDKYIDFSLPNFDGLTSVGDESTANAEGWYATILEDFNLDTSSEKTFEDLYGEANGGIWTTSPHNLRWASQVENKPEYSSYWCPDTVSVKDGKVEIISYQTDSHKCSQEKCPAKGRFTGGIETRKIVNGDDLKGDSDKLLFSQAFGYFETKVKFPNAKGLWSAFWLQSSNQRKIGNEGVDGTEIDIYESAFIANPKQMGHALLWDGYGKYAKVNDYIGTLDYDLYEGEHTFGLKWTPEYYVFYIDGVATWATRGGGVAKVAEYLRLTVEMDAGDGYGPHGQKIGQFDSKLKPVFSVDYVKVYQNKNFNKYIISDDSFAGTLDKAN